MKGWKENCLSRASKEILIKAVAQSIPNYITSCYKMPLGCCQQIDAMLRRFWWGSDDESKKIHWVSWDKLATVKGRGGMGFKLFSESNNVLLGKHCWRLISGSNHLLDSVLRSRYYPRGEFLNTNWVINQAMLGGVL